MPFEIIRNDITKVTADAIVNTANPDPIIGSGTDSAIYEAAGREKLLKERKKIGAITPGETAVTPAFRLSAKYIIHTVGPVWNGGEDGELETLASCYRKSLLLARQLKCESIAFPLISTGVYGFPKDAALRIALENIKSFLETEEMDVKLVVFDRTSWQLSSELNEHVRSYISDHIAIQAAAAEYSCPSMSGSFADRRRKDSRKKPFSLRPSASIQYESQSISDTDNISLADLIRTPAETFQQYLLRKIDEKGLSDTEVYKKANIDRKLFSKIRCNPSYTPKKKTALAFAVALEMDLDETKDFLSRAGLALSPSSTFDLIIEYCITHEIYDIFEINSLLFEYDQQLLGY